MQPRGLNSLADNEKSFNKTNYSLDAIKKILAFYGNPEKKTAFVHIAGTNGKGATAYFLNSILIEAGCNCGLYTSPHLVNINERIKLNGIDISSNDLQDYADDTLKSLSSINASPTWFDIITVIALRYFCDREAEIVILETGLGGRLDSTNVVIPECSILTDISLDHENVLGKDIKNIVKEKCGIIKKGGKLISSNITNPAIEIIEKTARRKQCGIMTLGRDFQPVVKTRSRGRQSYDLNVESSDFQYSIDDIIINYSPPFQAVNSSLAAVCSLLLKKNFCTVTGGAIKKGLLKTVIPGRYEIRGSGPFYIFDPAHNMAAVQTLTEALQYDFPDYNVTAVLTIMKDKNYSDIIRHFKNKGFNIIYFNIPDERSLKLKNNDFQVPFTENINELKRMITNIIHPKPLLLFTGSFRLYKYYEQITGESSEDK